MYQKKKNFTTGTFIYIKKIYIYTQSDAFFFIIIKKKKTTKTQDLFSFF